jgi:hypothetical protein
MKEVNRRDVLRAASGAAALTAAQYSRVKGANERVKLGVIGCGGRGTFVMNVFKNNPVDIVAFCDVWETRAERARATAGASARAFGDHRTQGKLYIDRSVFRFTPAGRNAQPVEVKSDGDQTIHHVANFLECMRTRALPNADVLIGHRSAQASHLANIAYVQKRRIKFDPLREEILPL